MGPAPQYFTRHDTHRDRRPDAHPRPPDNHGGTRSFPHAHGTGRRRHCHPCGRAVWPPRRKVDHHRVRQGQQRGDGFVAGRLLRRKNARVHIFLLASPTDLSRDAKHVYQRFQRTAGRSAVTRATDAEQLRQRFATSDVLIDAIVGTGLSAPITGLYLDAVLAINAAARPTVAVDFPPASMQTPEAC